MLVQEMATPTMQTLKAEVAATFPEKQLTDEECAQLVEAVVQSVSEDNPIAFDALARFHISLTRTAQAPPPAAEADASNARVTNLGWGIFFIDGTNQPSRRGNKSLRERGFSIGKCYTLD